MIVPSIDIQGGQAVQLVGGKDLAVEAGDPRPLAEQFGVVGPIAVIDLDAAKNQGNNRALIEDVCRRARCRVGGGIRTVEDAIRWLDAGAEQVIIGTAATPELLCQLPQERVIAALDAVHGEVVVDGWETRTGRSILEGMAELREVVGGFLVTFVEREGRLAGTNLDQVQSLVDAAGEAKITVAGGVTTAEELAKLDALGVDAQVGMALYTGKLTLAEALAGMLKSDRPDGLWPTVVTDEHGVALGLCYSNQESLQAALQTGRGVYHSRRRGLWVKGESSGATQTLLNVDLDCDRDVLRFRVRQTEPGFCHKDTWTCWGDEVGVPGLARVLADRAKQPAQGSYTARLLNEPELLAAKLIEEAGELASAEGKDAVAHEVADVFYFAMVAMVRAGVSLDEVSAVLDRRSLRVTRRRGDAKPPKTGPGAG